MKNSPSLKQKKNRTLAFKQLDFFQKREELKNFEKKL